MRYAALAFGIVAGLVASLVLALGGLDLDLLAIDQRQLAGVRFGLFVIANLGVFGAGLVLGAPLAAVALFILGALAWVGAAIMLHHGPDMVMLVPPALLLVAAGVSFASWFFARRAAQALPTMSRSAGFNEQRDAYTDNRGDDEDDADAREPALAADAYDDMPRISVGAGFFGEGGTAMPLRAEAVEARSAPAVDEDEEEPTVRRSADWRPGRKRPPPPRTASVFREIESDDVEDDESTFARLARVIGGLLSFGLYAALAGAAILIFFNLQSRDTGQPTATKVDAVSSEPSAQPSVVNRASSSAAVPKPDASELPNLTATTSTPASLPPVSSAEASADASAPVVLRGLPGVVIVDLPAGVEATEISPASSEPAASSVEPAASAPPAVEVVPPANTLSDPNIVVPWPVPAILAAQRAKPSPRPPQQTTAPAAPRVDTTGL